MKHQIAKFTPSLREKVEGKVFLGESFLTLSGQMDGKIVR